MFEVGDKVVYPHHGAGTVVKKEKREILGQTREYLTIQILHNDMTVNVPVENAEQVGLRTVIDEDLVNTLAQYMELEPLEKQALLEREGLLARCRSLIELLEMKMIVARHDWSSGKH